MIFLDFILKRYTIIINYFILLCYTIMLSHFSKKIIPSFLCVVFSLSIIWSSLVSVSFGQVNEDYVANYGISQTWEDIMTNFITIQSTQKRGDQVPASVFSALYTDFVQLFPQLPQKNNYRIIFDTCKVQAQKLSQVYTSLDFDIFVDQCQGPINTIMKEINANSTVKAKIKASPQSWSAPMTVTLDARDTVDPSEDTIPSQNFYRYYKNTAWEDILIWRWSVVNYTFEQEGNYYVHLTAKSANKETQGILDGEETVVITVAPEIANIVIYANGKKLQQRNYTKIGTQDAQRWVLFDGSATLPKWGREIQSHTWEVSGINWFKYASETITWKPETINLPLPNNGSYTIKLSLIDNEGNSITKAFLVAVSDPIAIIKQSPENITTSTMWNFDASASYALNSRIRKYNWEVFDDKGDVIFLTQQKSFTRQFTKPGLYTVKLTVTDELGESNTETNILEIESTTPQAQFTITPRLDRQFPSQFVLDASATFDIDVTNKYDAITYDRSFSNPGLTKIEQEYDNKQAIVVSFEEPGKHNITLRVTDSFGKTNTFSREVDVQSSLRPIILANPRATVRGNVIRFLATSNSEIINHERDFGDGLKEITQNKTTNHTYKKAGVYHVKLTATDRKWKVNTITTPVFIGEKDTPIGAYSVTNTRQNILRATDICEWEPAFVVNRGERITIDGKDSVNSKWDKSNLKFYFKPQDDEIYSTNLLQYSFKAMWCKQIEINVEETTTSKIDKKLIRFKVQNDLPILDSMGIFFPQFGNEIGVGLGQGTQEKTFDPLKVNPLIVKVTANNPKDRDWVISQFVWYYYKADDPTRIIDMRSTPSNVPYTHFTIYTNDPALWAGDIVFGVKMIDNDGGEQLSEDIIGQGPTFFNPPCKPGGLCDNNMDIPIVTLTIDKTDVAVGEEVVFETKAKTLSNRPDFNSQKIIRYDFDGDGTWDLTTKDTKVTHIYDKPYDDIKPRVEVSYRKNPVVFVGDKITVKQKMKPLLEANIYDKTVYLRDYSIGQIEKREICFTGPRDCQIVGTGDDLSYTYEEYGTYNILYTISDSYGNKTTQTLVATLQAPDNNSPMYLMSIPKANVNSEGRYVIPLANNQDNSVLLHIVYSGTGDCFVDTDITHDANFDGKVDNDKDIACNTSKLVKYDSYSDTINARVVYEWTDKKLIGNGILVQFTEQTIQMSQEQKLQYNKIQNIIQSLPNSNEDQNYIRTLLIKMADNVKTNSSQTEAIINMRVFLENSKAGLSEDQLTSITTIMKEFETSDSIALNGGNIVDQVRQFLIDFAPSASMKTQIKEYFDVIANLPEPAAQPEIVKNQLQSVVQLFSDNAVSSLESQNKGNEEKVIIDDIETQVIPRICDVLSFYGIGSNLCPDDANVKVATATNSGWGIWAVLKWVGIVVGILWGIFLLIVIFFAVKARLQQNADEEAQTETPQ